MSDKKHSENKSGFKTDTIFIKNNCVLKGVNKDYPIKLSGLPVCSKECPAGVNVKAYIHHIANRKFEEAVDVIREANPFPAVCGRICTRPCEDHCELGVNGDSISIRTLKRYASDYELARRSPVMKPCEITQNEKIAVIGSGPAGLTAAVDLIRLGYLITVFEEKQDPGGMLRYGIPSYRLPDRILKKDIEWIKGLGVEIQTKKRINDPCSLLKKGFSAVLIAGGAPKSFPLGIEGEDAEGIVDALWILQEINMDHSIDIKGNIVVIGGGSTAFDVARSTMRLGVNKVTVAYRRGIKEMPADHEEIEEAQKEGVKLLTLAIPKRIITQDGKVKGVEFLKVKLGEPDHSGRKRPIPIKDSEFTLNADMVIPAVGAMPDVESVGCVKVTTPKGVVNVSKYGQTTVNGIFAAGDVEMGPSSVVEAIGRGHEAAKGIHAYLREINILEEKEKIESFPIILETLPCSHLSFPPKKMIEKGKVLSFKEVTGSISDFEAVDEALRCFTCGSCQACPVCLPNCNNKQLVAQTNDISFLMKTPSTLSSEITQKGPSTFTMKCDEKTTSINLISLTSVVNRDLCIGCGRCEEVCSYRAIKNVLEKDGQTFSQVVHDACASCSACVSACPSGAITQGFMSDKEILLRLENEKTPYDGVKAIISYWNTPYPTFGRYRGVVEVMSERKSSPSFLMKALSRSGRGILVIGPDEKTGSHYLPWEEKPEEIVHRAQSLLKLVGVSPDRIQYKAVPYETKPSILLKEYSEFLDKKNLKKLKILFPNEINSPLGEAITILRILSANPDENPSEEYEFSKPIKTNGTAFFEGCLPMLYTIGKAHKLFDLGPTRKAIHELLEKIKIDYGTIEGFSCPSKGLLKTNIKGIEETVEEITVNNLKFFNKAKPKKLILGTPESYFTFSKERDYECISSLLDELWHVLKKSKDFKPIKKTIAIHKACAMKTDPFYEDTKKLIERIPGVKIVELKEKCNHNGFESLNSKSKQSALILLKEAEKKGADIVICTSPYCESYLLLCQRKGSWRSNDIEISNAYKLLLASLDGDN